MITLYNDDCYKKIKDIPDNSVDLVIIDPPYDFMSNHTGKNYIGDGAFGTLGRTYHSELANSNLITGIDTKQILDELCRIMKKTYIYIWCSKDQLREYLNYFKGCNMDLLTWHKTNPVPTCCNKYLSDTEYLLLFKEKHCKLYGTYQTKKKYYVSPTNKEDKKKYQHPTIKPLEIIENIIINSSNEGDTILDCFMGSGTTGVACKELNRNFIGIEIDKTYFDIAEKRINEVNSQMSIFDLGDTNGE